MFEGFKNKIRGIKDAKDELSNTIGPLGEIVDAFKEKGAVSVDHSYAALNIVKRKLENNIFILGLISSFIFFVFYIYMIIQKYNVITNVIIYSLLFVLLIISTIFDIILYPGKQKKLNFLEIKHFKFLKNRKKYIFAFLKMAIKTFSLIYALIEIIMYGKTIHAVASLSISFGLYVIQLLIYFITYVAMSYLNYLLIGFEEDMNNSGIYLISKNNRYKAHGIEALSTEKENEIREEIRKEVVSMKPMKEKNEQIKLSFGKYEAFKKKAMLLYKDKNLKDNRKEIEKLLLDANNKFNELHNSIDYNNKTYLIINFVKATIYEDFESSNPASIYHAMAYLMYFIDVDTKVDLDNELEEFYNYVLEDIPGLKEYYKSLTK